MIISQLDHTRELGAPLAQYVRRMKIPLMTSNFWVKRNFPHVTHV